MPHPSRSMSTGAMAFNLSQQNLSQSRTSIHSLDSHLNQSAPTSQIPSYCTLPRQVPGQNQSLSAFHPVVSKSAPNSPRAERREISPAAQPMQRQVKVQEPQLKGHEAQIQGSESQVKGHEPQVRGYASLVKGQLRSVSQPSSPTQAQQMINSIYGVKSSKVSDADAPVKVLQTSPSTAAPTGIKYSIIHSCPFFSGG